ncbi:beta-ketoacyl synthase chain length factor [Luteimonas abyssi]|uniref:beta-ketoacyl synthase chain length factor n=1 Tax=Luteimonas abyssi TaxID=1247514 RepID=UPI000737AD89|nr:beta-ketoacyl synthase chain length factor [Luteimonas abyssi]
MTRLSARIAGVGFWASGLPGWAAAQAAAEGAPAVSDAPKRPAPSLLAANERRRAPESVVVAIEVAQAACRAADRDPATLPSIFVSTCGDFAITDAMCTTLANDPLDVSPTRFHNSVHNAAAGYWTIGTGCTRTTTALAAGPGSFAQGLLEALVQLATGDDDAVLLVAYDTAAVGVLAHLAPSSGLLGGGLVLVRDDAPGGGPSLSAVFDSGVADAGDGPLARRLHGNAMAGMLPLFDALARRADGALALDAGAGRRLRLEVRHD